MVIVEFHMVRIIPLRSIVIPGLPINITTGSFMSTKGDIFITFKD